MFVRLYYAIFGLIFMIWGYPACYSIVPPFIRVQLNVNSQSCTIVLPGNCTILNQHKQVLLQQSEPSKITIGIHSKGLSWQGKPLPETYLLFQSKRTDHFFQIAGKSYRGDIFFQYTTSLLLVVNVLPVDQYLAGILSQEISQDDPEEYKRLVAIMLRSQILFEKEKKQSERYDRKAQGEQFEYIGIAGENKDSLDLIHSTAGCVLLSQNTLFPLYSHTSCGGATANASDVFDIPYHPALAGQTCQICEADSSMQWDVSLQLSDLQRIFLELRCATQQEISTKQGLGIMAQTMDQYGRVLNVNMLCGKRKTTISSHQLANHDKWLTFPSTRFTITIQNNRLYVQGKGFGHGIGLCQHGAIELSKTLSAESILELYFPTSRVYRMW